jgi:hypothetical protein
MGLGNVKTHQGLPTSVFPAIPHRAGTTEVTLRHNDTKDKGSRPYFAVSNLQGISSMRKTLGSLGFRGISCRP